jgi:SAM-dependent methyltransferase
MGRAVEVILMLYRTVVPEIVRKSSAVAKLKERWRGHDWIYDSDYYRIDVEGPAVRSAGTMVRTIMEDLKPTSAVDVGCGTGALLEALRNNGCTVFGLEYANAALRYCRERRLDVAKFDLENDSFRVARTFDIALSMEVAEHLPESVADRYVDLLTSLSSVVVLTAAPPGQTGTDHVNEQLPAYWISKFERRGFARADELTERWRNAWKAAGDVASWYYTNLMVFRRLTGVGTADKLSG